jgi:lipopolysaccharide export system permease protein
MTFGNLAENYEFAAMKSAGIIAKSDEKPYRFYSFTKCYSFFFANNVIPYAEYKFINFRKHCAGKPAMAIAEGSLTWKYNIKVKKNQETTEVF